jgi:Protein of unknown function (DUF3187)
MNMMARCAWIAAVCASIGAPAARAEEGVLFGLLRERDLTPFGFLRLDMRPAHAVDIEPHTWAIETEIGYQNTWALSPEVHEYLMAHESAGRHELGPADAATIQALPGENYLLDGEIGTLDVTFHYKLSQHWTAYLIASAVTYQGGFLDSTIESFHDTFGFEDFGRPAVKKDDFNVIFDLKSTQFTAFSPPIDGGLLDPTLGVRYIGWSMPKPWRLTLEAAVKIPVSGRRLLLSTGRTDWGLQASLQRFSAHHAWYFNLAAVYYDGQSEPTPHDSQVVPTFVFGYEHILTRRWNVNVQGYVSPSVYSHDQTDLDELLGEKYQVSFGVRYHTEHFAYTFGFTENLQNLNNTPDIGLQLGVAYVPHPVVHGQ